jgi:hypothetical protein
MGTTNARTVVELRGMTIDIRSSEVVYIEIGDRTYYIDDSTGEAIMESWPTSAMPPRALGRRISAYLDNDGKPCREERHCDLNTIDLDHDLGTRDLTSPFGEEA